VDAQRVTDAADPRLADYIGLTDERLRRRREPEEGIFIAEGAKVIERAVAAGYAVRSMLLEEKWLGTVAQPARDCGAPIYLADRRLLEQVTGYEVHRGALAAMSRLPLPPVHEVVAAADRLLVLEDVNNHTNIGVIFRAAAALGFGGVLLSPTCADPLYRRAVRVSMGTVFALPYARLPDWPAALHELRAEGFAVLALTPEVDAVALPDVPAELTRRCVLLLGAEGPGLTAGATGCADLRVRIPMSHGVDSLNVAAAAAVACYAITAADATPQEPPPRGPV